MRRVVIGLVVGLFAGLVGREASAIPIVYDDCAVRGSGAFPNGEMFEGSASSTVEGIFRVDWEHTAPGIEFRAEITDGVNCIVDGGPIAFIDGFGTGVLNGVPGYYYLIFAEDRREPLRPAVTLSASRSGPPALFVDGEATFDPPRELTIPAAVEVTEGSAGHGWTRLYIDDVRCDYQGNGSTFDFVRCSGRPDLVPGVTLPAASARLRVRSPGERADGERSIAVRATLAPTVYSSGAPDMYGMTVFDAFGNIIYDFGANLLDGQGDLIVELRR